ncbi:cytochrome b/b6 domain-containing protein [Rhizorhabdus sp.]|uniref:cytochrome b/b6 domain-containing protein n=1 Tax=Rhizorhabdus sp. TaxID=1968843 RepID=UPI0035B1ABC7
MTPSIATPRQPNRQWIKRHRWPTRLWHWTNAVAMLIMLMSGLMIFNAHPRLYWGDYGANSDKAWLQIGSRGDKGLLVLGKERFETTGVLGLWTDARGIERRRAFPGWATIPTSYSLADARIWHFFFAWVLVGSALLFFAASIVNGHFRTDLLPRRRELGPKHIWSDIVAHAKLRFPAGEAAKHYGILQKAAYLSVIVLLLPLIVLTGLTMSPAMNAAWPWLLDLFGGRQSARSIHFLCAAGLVLFFVIHIAMVFLAGPINEVRSMITGWYRLPEDKA